MKKLFCFKSTEFCGTCDACDSFNIEMAHLCEQIPVVRGKMGSDRVAFRRFLIATGYRLKRDPIQSLHFKKYAFRVTER